MRGTCFTTGFFVIIIMAGFRCGNCRAAAATPEALYMVAAEAPSVMRLARDTAAVPAAVAEILRLPMGILQLVLSPLPAISAKSGLTNVGHGLLGPFKLATAVLKLPASVVSTVGDIANSSLLR